MLQIKILVTSTDTLLVCFYAEVVVCSLKIGTLLPSNIHAATSTEYL